MKNISLDITKAQQFLPAGAIMAFKDKVAQAQKGLEECTVPGNDFLGWLHLPSSITPEFLNEVKACAETLRSKAEVVVIAGIGGSYLGAKAMEKQCGINVPFEENPAALYAATRNALYAAGKKIEILINYQPKLHFYAEWWKQLFGESEGKDGKGIFPASCDFTTDLHSMGQWIQNGERTIFETCISVESPEKKLLFPSDAENLDGLNFLAGKRIDEVNKNAELGTRLAHVDGGVPNILVSIERLDAYNYGQLIYFFEIACGISGQLLGVNAFNQPGVEAYKKNMFALLEKPGYEEETKAIRAKLAAE